MNEEIISERDTRRLYSVLAALMSRDPDVRAAFENLEEVLERSKQRGKT